MRCGIEAGVRRATRRSQRRVSHPHVPLKRLDHVSLNVADREASIAWYRDVVGLEPRSVAPRDDWPVFMGELGACVALFQAQSRSADRMEESTGLRHIAFMVDGGDLERARARLQALGIDLRTEDHGSSSSLYFSDPDGNVIELTSYER